MLVNTNDSQMKPKDQSDRGYVLAPEVVFLFGGLLKRSRVPVLTPGHSAASFQTNFLSLYSNFLYAAFFILPPFAFRFLPSLLTSFPLYPLPPDSSFPI